MFEQVVIIQREMSFSSLLGLKGVNQTWSASLFSDLSSHKRYASVTVREGFGVLLKNRLVYGSGLIILTRSAIE